MKYDYVRYPAAFSIRLENYLELIKNSKRISARERLAAENLYVEIKMKNNRLTSRADM